jgi:hypothetical protein
MLSQVAFEFPFTDKRSPLSVRELKKLL